MASCDSTVLTGQEGLIQFKPLGTTNCIDDYCPFAGERIYLPCGADYNIDDCVDITPSKIPAGEGQAPTGGSVITEGDSFWIIGEGKGVAGDEDACGNDMAGVPYIVVSETKGGSAVTWDNTLAGDEMMTGHMTGDNIAVTNQGSGYNGGSTGTVTGVEVIGGKGSGAEVTLTVGAAGAITSFTVTEPGRGYEAGDAIQFEAENGGGGDASDDGGRAGSAAQPGAEPRSQRVVRVARRATGGAGAARWRDSQLLGRRTQHAAGAQHVALPVGARRAGARRDVAAAQPAARRGDRLVA